MNIKVLTVMALLAIGSAGHAEEFKCNFTEPFVTLTYSTQAQKLVQYGDFGQGLKKVTIKKVAFEILGAGKFQLKDQSSKVLLSLDLNNVGSDGMSSNVFPYSVTYSKLVNMANNGIGGCSSSLLPVVVDEDTP